MRDMVLIKENEQSETGAPPGPEVFTEMTKFNAAPVKAARARR